MTQESVEEGEGILVLEKTQVLRAGSERDNSLKRPKSHEVHPENQGVIARGKPRKGGQGRSTHGGSIAHVSCPGRDP